MGRLLDSPRTSAAADPALRRSALCLIASAGWALVPFSRSSESAALDFWGYVALVGSGVFTLLVVAVCFDARDREGSGWSSALTLGCGLAALPWAILAYWLQVGTHHRPLGAATFAIGALLIGGFAVAVARHVLAFAATEARLGPPVLMACRVLALASVALLLVVLGSASLDHVSLGRIVPELVAGVLLGALVVSLPVSARLAAAAAWALPVCAILCLISLWLVQSEADVRATVKSAPLIAGVFGLATP